jgi:hypothetical protein
VRPPPDTWDHRRRLAPLLLERAADFWASREKFLVDRLEKRSPATVRHIVPRPIDLPVADILRNLVDEGLSVEISVFWKPSSLHLRRA